MKKIRLSLIFIFLISVLEAKEIIIEQNRIYESPISALNKSIIVAGEVKDSLFLIGGKLKLSGKIYGDVIMISGKIEIEPGAYIQRDLILIGTTAKIPPDFKPDGEFFNIKSRQDLKEIAAKIIPFLPEGKTITFMILFKILIWVLISFLILALFPKKIVASAQMLQENLKKYFWSGILIFAVLVILVFFSIVLSAFLIGVPLLLLLLMIYMAMIIFGRTVVFFSFGKIIFQKLKISKADPALYIIPGALLYSAGKLLPLFGFAIILFIDFFALSCRFLALQLFCSLISLP